MFQTSVSIRARSSARGAGGSAVPFQLHERGDVTEVLDTSAIEGVVQLIGGRPARARVGWQREIGRLDKAMHTAIAITPTPRLDRGLRGLSRSADRSMLWSAIAAGVAAQGGPAGQRAAVNGMASIAATSAAVSLAVKPLARRARPDRRTSSLPLFRRVAMPRSISFPSGHAASAFAFATGVGVTLPRTALPLSGLAALVAYSRVHTGVHYPSDVIVGSIIGSGLAPAVMAGLDHLRAGQREPRST